MNSRWLVLLVSIFPLLAATGCLWSEALFEAWEHAPPSRPGSSSSTRSGWPLAGFDLMASGHNPHERTITPDNVGQLRVEWVFDSTRAGAPVRAMHGTPVVDRAGNLYIGDFAGTFFSISREGEPRWSFATDPPSPQIAALSPPELGAITASPIIGSAALAEKLPLVVVADANGRIYARDRQTGAEVWTARGLNSNPLGGVSGNALTIVDDLVLVGFSSLENYAFVLSAAGLRVDCCAHQGALIALDLATGSMRWKHELVPPAKPLPPAAAPFTLGPSGADVWSQPTVDVETQTVYVSTGQNLSPDANGRSTHTSDAIVAIDLATGARKWVHQFTEGDIWAVGVTNPDPVTGKLLDMDLGDAPKIYRLASGQKVVGAGQKDGRYHVVDALTGELVRTTALMAPRNDLGGLQTGGAFAAGIVLQHGLDATAGFTACNEGRCPYEGFTGRVVALSADGASERWSLRRPVSPLAGGLAVANGLVYFQSPVEESRPMIDAPTWALYALELESGAIRARLPFPGRALGSPVVADGHVYVTDGNLALNAYGVFPDGGLIRLGLPSCEHAD